MTALQKLQDKALGNTKPVEIISALEACIVRSYSKHENKKGFYAKLDEKAAEELAALTARVKELEGLLEFAVNNKQNFTEHDSDGVIGAWIEQAEKTLSAMDDES